ncbi:NADH-quinone oxidoreductase subunit NuoN [Thiomicrospira sp. R3]|uniref:NADH-quinone oxidoreductase subunit NuoN n=1 Tax=Thiomicrospira sp. R3 TaxID=3035472 RepID=UPI00259BE07F|nr:NADH-quinone oxidoreductase subunit NuoN [Thiomicrospira sp. R3]WFE68086.1 NADH-quinone oxidoreductase subunit NuoN [Thiomicrospira sp. R3]
MNFVIPDFTPAVPEMVLLALTSFILIADTFWSERYKYATYYATQATLVIVGLLILFSFTSETTVTFNESFVRDAFADVLKIFIVIVSIGVFLFSKEYLKNNDFYQGEFFTLGLFAVLGMFVMVSAYNFITLFVGLEIMSLAMYAMIAMQRDSSKATEAAIKYFVLGALATGLLLYGLSMIYGATGTLTIPEVKAVIEAGKANSTVLAFGVVFIVIGLGFKLGAVPFHMWVPDVYDGAPTAVTLFIAAAPKIAAFAIVYRLLVDGMPGLVVDWQQLLVIMAILSMVVGTVIALAQTNFKRLLAYSGIAHIGFLLLGFIAATPEGYSAAMFYVLVYAITSVAAFGMILALSRKGLEFDQIKDFAGMNKRNPWLAAMMLIIMFSMAGVPPFIGFYAKLVVLEEVIAAGFTWLAIIGVITAIAGAFYYLRVIKVMYFDTAEQDTPLAASTKEMSVAVSVYSLSLLVLGIMPAWLMTVAYNSLLM